MALLVGAACSSLDETETHANDTANGGSGGPGNSPGAEPAPGSPTHSGDPISTSGPGGGPDEGGQNQGPGATETNFLTLPCNTDADCGGARCILLADASQSGPASDAGARDAGDSDAGPPQSIWRGRCSPGL